MESFTSDFLSIEVRVARLDIAELQALRRESLGLAKNDSTGDLLSEVKSK
jgi:hypothetical protein